MKTYPVPIFLVIIYFLLTSVFSVIAQNINKGFELPLVESSTSESYFTTEYFPPANEKEGQLQIPVTYTLWIPEGLKQVRGIIVHQHGCGEGSCKYSVTAAHDLHWQELAKRNDCALLGPSFHQLQEQDCALWSNPGNGSGKVFLNSLKKLAEISKHQEIATVPWCLWGHSGGGIWISLMQIKYPERIVAMWFQSGTAFGREGYDFSDISDVAMKIPMMVNSGLKEKTHEKFSLIWDTSVLMFKEYRGKGAPIAFAPDPATGHETGDSRYLAIPFFDACLKLRLPDKIGDPLKTVDQNAGWVAPLLCIETPVQAKDYKGDLQSAVWLPNESVAMAWNDFVQTGTVGDLTPPPVPTNIQFDEVNSTLSWNADIDFESGLRAFIIERDGKRIGQIPEKQVNPFGRSLFQGMTYGDTPVLPLLKFQFVDSTAVMGESSVYRIISVNSAGLQSRWSENQKVLKLFK
jgi:hypothetical protein